jgi:hypothetical protein
MIWEKFRWGLNNDINRKGKNELTTFQERRKSQNWAKK